MRVAILTDASLNPDKSIAGYAYYIGCKEGKIQNSGTFKFNIKSVHTAELRCIGNALHTLLKSDLKGVTQIALLSDSLMCVNAINLDGILSKRADRVDLEKVMMLMMQICIKYGKSITDMRAFFKVSHIKAHTKNTDKLSTINNWCDTEARRMMRLESNKKSNQKNK